MLRMASRTTAAAQDMISFDVAGMESEREREHGAARACTRAHGRTGVRACWQLARWHAGAQARGCGGARVRRCAGALAHGAPPPYRTKIYPLSWAALLFFNIINI